MKYKLLCTDMDGTLLNDEKKISDRNLKAIKSAQEKGVKIVVCTGRMFESAHFYAELMGGKTPVIAANGAYIREKDRGAVIYKSLLGVESCKNALGLLKKHSICLNFHTSDTVLIEEISEIIEWYRTINQSLPEQNQLKVVIVEDWDSAFEKYKEEIVKCIAIDLDLSRLNAAKAEFLSQDEFEVVSSHTNNFEIMKKGASKGRAAEILAGYYNLKKEEVICIGDSENDLSMIQYAGLGVAMGNAEQYIKEASDYVTDTNNEDGVAKVIEEFILKNR